MRRKTIFDWCELEMNAVKDAITKATTKIFVAREGGKIYLTEYYQV
jgi:hypothetical protein